MMPAEQTPIQLIQMDLPLDNLIPNDYAPNEMGDSRLHLVIKRPVWVKCVGEGENHLEHRHEVVDGLHGWSVAKELGIKTVFCEIYRMSNVHAMAVRYQATGGVRNPFKEGLIFMQARALAPDPGRLHEYFMLPADYIARRMQLIRIYHIYRRHASSPNILLTHWEAMANFRKESEDDEILEEICFFLEENTLPTESLQRLLRQLRGKDVVSSPRHLLEDKLRRFHSVGSFE